MPLALAPAAWAAPTLVPPTGPRTVKIDLFSADPRSHPWGSDWKVTLIEQWTAVLSCQREGKVERCRFVDGAWWSVVVAGSDQRVSIHLPAPGELEFVWNPRGRLSSWDVSGDRSAFWTAASNAQLKQVFHRPDMVFKPDAQREIGARLEQSLTRGLAGALEWELPKTGDPEGGWAPTQTPWVARRWVQSTSSPRLHLAVAGDDGGRTALSMTGSVIERATEVAVVDLGRRAHRRRSPHRSRPLDRPRRAVDRGRLRRARRRARVRAAVTQCSRRSRREPVGSQREDWHGSPTAPPQSSLARADGDAAGKNR